MTIDEAIDDLEASGVLAALGCSYDYRPYKRYAHLAYGWLDAHRNHCGGETRNIRQLRTDVALASGERMSDTSCGVAVHAHPAFKLLDGDWYRPS